MVGLLEFINVKTEQGRLEQCYTRTVCTELRLLVAVAQILILYDGPRDRVVAKDETSLRESNPSMCPSTLLTDILAPNNLTSR